MLSIPYTVLIVFVLNILLVEIGAAISRGPARTGSVTAGRTGRHSDGRLGCRVDGHVRGLGRAPSVRKSTR